MYSVLKKVGNTPLIKFVSKELDSINLFVKLEFYNPTGSVKDRAANYIIDKLLDKGIINKDTTLIESSSGNFGIALSSYCKKHNLNFYCVIDPHITKVNEFLIRSLSNNVIKVTEPDDKGGYLLSRIKKVKELNSSIENSYWVNQYKNPYNAEAYYRTIGNEICKQITDINYVFLGVSSGGTITGISKKVKNHFPNAKIIAVDIDGSVIFNGKPKKRYIPGIGSSMVPEILKNAQIDDVVTVNELDTIKMCHKILKENTLFVGGSSGSVMVAIKKYFMNKNYDKKPNVVTIFPDRGDRYINTIYDNQWVESILKKSNI